MLYARGSVSSNSDRCVPRTWDVPLMILHACDMMPTSSHGCASTTAPKTRAEVHRYDGCSWFQSNVFTCKSMLHGHTFVFVEVQKHCEVCLRACHVYRCLGDMHRDVLPELK